MPDEDQSNLNNSHSGGIQFKGDILKLSELQLPLAQQVTFHELVRSLRTGTGELVKASLVWFTRLQSPSTSVSQQIPLSKRYFPVGLSLR